MNKKIIPILFLLLFLAIGLWKFSKKLDVKKSDKNHYSNTEVLDTVSTNSSGTVRSNETVHVIYNYLPSVSNGTKVKHKYYTLSYNEEYEQAEWVAYKLNTSFTTGSAKRASSFYNDKIITTGSAEKDDYKYSGYDRGHLLPAGDRKMTKEAMRETFYMSNISPQDPNLNRKAWKYLEEKIRERTYDYDSLYIITGPIIQQEHEKIGENQVAVPSYFYKIILNYTNTSSLCATAFIFPNTSVKKLTNEYIVTIDEIEAITSIDFFNHLPIDVQEDFEEKNCLEILN